VPVPDPLDAATLREQLTGPGGSWRCVEVVETTGSTNADLADRARAGERPGAALVAGHQSAGRGRRGRTWTAPPGTSLAISALVRPARPLTEWTWVPLLAGLAVAEALESGPGVPARLKWPNDVLVAGRKLCGILVERVEAPAGPVCVVGIGINVHLTAADLPVPTATSLALLDPRGSPRRTEVAAAVLARLAEVLAAWERDPAGVRAAYRALSDTVGREVSVALAGGAPVAGRAIGVDEEGRLRLETATGPLTVGAGDVVHVR